MYEYQARKSGKHPIQRAKLLLRVPMSPTEVTRTSLSRMWEVDSRGAGREWIKKWLDDSVYTQRDEIKSFLDQMRANGGPFTVQEMFLILYARKLLSSKPQTSPVSLRAYFRHVAEFVRLSRDRGEAAPINIDETEMEMVRYGPLEIPCVRVYRISFAPAALSGMGSPGLGRGDAISPSGHHDVQQDREGNVVIATGKKRADASDSTLYMDFGRPDRALRWALKYSQERPPGRPVVRSFLIPVGIYKTMILNTRRQTEQQRAGFIENSDYSSAPNQLGISPRFLPLLRQTAIAGSLISYPLDGQTSLANSGMVTPISRLSEKVGIEGDFQSRRDLFYDAWLREEKGKGGKTKGVVMKTGEDDADYAEQMSGLCDFWSLLIRISISRRAGGQKDLNEIIAFLTARDALLKAQIGARIEGILSKYKEEPEEKRANIRRSLEANARAARKEQSVWTAFLKVLKMSGSSTQLPEDYESITEDIFVRLLELAGGGEANRKLKENMRTIAQLASIARANAMLAEGFSTE